MPEIRRATWRRSDKPVRNEMLRFNQAAPPEPVETTAHEMTEIELTLALMASAECEMGCDYPEGPLSPQGCQW